MILTATTLVLSTVLGARILPNGDQVNFDGACYDFRAANGRSMVKLWVPPTAKPVRGILISGHGGDGGDSRDFARDANMKALAARFGFGLAGLHNFPGGRVYAAGGKVFFGALDAFADFGKHHELRNVPFAIFGSSNGGAQAYAFANVAPKRAICFVSNVSSWFSPPEPVDEALKVPGIFVMGRYDPFNRDQAGVDRCMAQVLAARAKGARWGMIVEEKGHEDGVAFDVYAKFLERSIALRYPALADPGKGPVALKEIPESQGWLADMTTWQSGFTTIADYRSYTGDKAKASWLPDADTAFVYRAAATQDNPIAIGIADVGRVYNPNTNPQTMYSVGGPIVTPGRTLRLVCDVRELPTWRTIEFFDGSRKLGEVHHPAEPTLKVRVGSTEVVWCLSAIATTADGQRRTASPFYFAVKDPAIELRSEVERNVGPGYRDAIGPVGSSAQTAPLPEMVANVLVGPGLTADLERTYGADARTPATFWEHIEPALDLRQRTHARNGSSFSIVHSLDARMIVKAAHSARGLYLYFCVTDNRFVESDPNPDRYNQIDVVDVLLDSKSSAAINDPANLLQAINSGWGLTLTTKQYQVALGGDTWPTVMKRIVPDPWDLDFHTVWPIADVRRSTGFEVRFAKRDKLTRVQEWFLPWSEFGLSGEPPVGTRLGFAPSYNDADPGEAGSKHLVWIDHTSPWENAMDGGKAPRGWGDIEIGPKL